MQQIQIHFKSSLWNPWASPYHCLRLVSTILPDSTHVCTHFNATYSLQLIVLYRLVPTALYNSS